MFLAFMEGLVRESDTKHTDALDRLYSDRVPKESRPKKDPAARRSEIARFARMTSGEIG